MIFPEKPEKIKKLKKKQKVVAKNIEKYFNAEIAKKIEDKSRFFQVMEKMMEN